jgi:hypothetical protein
MRFPFFLAAICTVLVPTAACAVSLDRAVLTEVINEVAVLQRKTKTAVPAKLRDEFRAPDVLRTGHASRAELTAPDDTVTRVGSNTLFSFRGDSREMSLEKGAILFHSPSGNGGGTIRTRAASAAVLGTTLIVSATTGGAMKVMLLEGQGKVTTRDGRSVFLAPGQLTLVLPGGRIGPVLDFQLSRQVAGSQLIRGFRRQLDSSPAIRREMASQERRIQSGKLRPPAGPRELPPARENGNDAPPPPPPPPRQQPPPPVGLPVGPQAGPAAVAPQAIKAPRDGQPPQKNPPPKPPPQKSNQPR